MKKALFIAWLALVHACMLQAQGVNVFDESSIGMGDSIDQEMYQVIYDLAYVYGNHHGKQGTNTNRITEQMLLQIGNLYSAFYSYPIFQRDSLIYSNMKKGIESNFSGNSGTINWKLYKNYPQQGKTAYLDFFAADRYLCIEPIENIDWQPTDSTDTICGYPCHQAVATFKGRSWTAWYAEDIPMQEGPWKLCGLPGLILKAYDENREYEFTAIGMSTVKTAEPITIGKGKREEISQEGLRKAKEKFTPGMMLEGLSTKIVAMKDEHGNDVDIKKFMNKKNVFNPIEL